ncbi:hypothetical protein DICVIV_04180 [Dictyocaulus viviparus]|uniref:Uncharacterized protein n=1 Tax=Dictyocaulus viviparus TaxID=29172 RepID=A0A0D8XYJ4_DICVI|nr:hypothetical protein DICVIV_04180 [Dictyocaulus viviparus]
MASQKWLRQHPNVLALPWKPNVRRAEKSNAIDVLCSGVLGAEVSLEKWQEYFTEPVNPLTSEDRKEWIAQLNGVVMSSDAFLPFRDNIDCAKQACYVSFYKLHITSSCYFKILSVIRRDIGFEAEGQITSVPIPWLCIIEIYGVTYH